jgi:hypothetical protein
MKKFLAVIFSAMILAVSAFTLAGCGCSNEATSTEPATDIVGDWGGRSDDIEVEFNDDGTCVIGGVTGTYEIDENNNLTVTPDSNGETESEPVVFEHYNGDNISAIQPNQWTVNGDILYINGQQYNSNSTGNSSENTQVNSDNTQSNGNANSTASSNTASSSKPADNSSSSGSSSTPDNSSSSSSTPNSSSSSSSTPDDSSSSSSEIISDGEEGDIANIVEILDDF